MNTLRILSKTALICFSALIFSGCKKEIIPPPGSTEPVFKAEGTFGGQNISLNAGDDNVLMATQAKELNGAQFFTGTLGNSEIEIEMGIFSGDLDMQTLPNFTGVTAIDLSYQPTQPLYLISKDSLPNASMIQQVQWEVNGVVAPELNVLKIYEPGKYNICAHITFTDYTVSSICNEVIVGFKRNADFQLNFFLGQDLSFKSWVTPVIGTIQSVKWYQNSQLLNNQEELNTNMNHYLNVIRAEVLFTNGITLSKTVLVDGSLEGHYIPDFTQYASCLPIQWDYTAKIKLKKDGTEYFSHTTPNASNKITVTEIAFHGKNAAGKSVYRLTGILDANMKNAAGTATLPLHLNVSFGFAVE